MKLTINPQFSPLKSVFSISRGAKTEAKTVTVTLEAGGCTGRGECVPYPRYGESIASVTQKIEDIRGTIEAGLDRTRLQSLLPAGAARCAVDCALWDLEAKQTGTPVWKMAGLAPPAAIETAVTVSLDTPDAMGQAAGAIDGKLLKLKLGSDDDIARLEAVHMARPDARLIVDGNEGLSRDAFASFAEAAANLGVVLIEQPFPVDADESLARAQSGLTICADESVHTSLDIPRLAERYDAVNVKLDKTGGLTEAIALVEAARAAEMEIMIGCMVAGSLSMAPALLLAGQADYVDLDGPLWLANDIEHGLTIEGGIIQPCETVLWG